MPRKPIKNCNIDRHGRGWRIRYVVNRKRFSVTVIGSRSEAQSRWLEIQTSIATDAHVAPTNLTFAGWVPTFLSLVEAKRRNARTAEYYQHKLRYAIDAFGDLRLQKITPSDIDKLTSDLKDKLSESSRRHVFVSTKACLNAAVRKGFLARNPADRAEGVDVDEVEIGEILPAAEFRAFIDGFKGHSLQTIVAVALHTGARRNEILAIRHSDVDYVAGRLRIARAVERTKKHGTRFKTPKSGKSRELSIDSELLAIFKAERERLARLIAGVEPSDVVDLKLVKLPPDALVFQPLRVGSVGYDKPRNDADVSRDFRKVALKLGYPRLRFHDLRGSHETALLEAGVPVHVVAARCGHSPQMLLKTYAERTSTADASAALAVAGVFSTKRPMS